MLRKLGLSTAALVVAFILSHTEVAPPLTVSKVTQPFKIDPVLATEEVEWLDSDGDACPDVQEVSLDSRKGGLRDPGDPYDFYDVTGWYSRESDGKIDVMDMQSVAFRWGATTGSLYYDAKYDRSVELVNGPFDLGPPDGEINIYDLQAMYAQAWAECQEKTSLSDIAPLCDGNLKEAKDPSGVVLVPGKTYKECKLIRDDSGKLVDVAILEETTAITDESFSDDPVVPEQVEKGIAPAAPSAEAAGSTIGPRTWQFGCITGHNRAYSLVGVHVV